MTQPGRPCYNIVSSISSISGTRRRSYPSPKSGSGYLTGQNDCKIADPIERPSRRRDGFACMLLLMAATGWSCVVLLPTGPAAAEPGASFNVDAKRAYGYLVRICRIGRRISGTAGMTNTSAV